MNTTIKVRVISSKVQEAKLLHLQAAEYEQLAALEKFELAAAKEAAAKPEASRGLWRTAVKAVEDFRVKHGLDPEGELLFR